MSRYLTGPWREDALPVNAFLIEHPGGLCLFDTGQSARAVERGYLPLWHPFLRLARFDLTAADEVAAQVRALDIDIGDVRWVVLSHLHTDHMGGLEPFRDSEVVVSRTEWERAQGLPGKVRGYLPQHWPRGLEPRQLALDAAGFGPFPAAHDLAGDASLLVVATPGHTPGHMSLLVKLPEGAVLLGGDVAHTTADLAQDAPAIARYCREEGIAYVGAHDPDARSILAISQTT